MSGSLSRHVSHPQAAVALLHLGEIDEHDHEVAAQLAPLVVESRRLRPKVSASAMEVAATLAVR